MPTEPQQQYTDVSRSIAKVIAFDETSKIEETQVSRDVKFLDFFSVY